MSGVRIHPSAVVEPGAQLGEDVDIGPFCLVSAQARLGDRSRLLSHVSVQGRVDLGADCIVHAHAALGGAPQDTKYDGCPNRLEIGERTVIREHVTMHAGTAANDGLTSIGHDGYFMVASHVAHDCVVGNHVTLANAATLGGHVSLGDHVTLGGLSGIHQHTRIGHHAFIGAMGCITRDVIPYGMTMGNPGALHGLNIIGMRRAGLARPDIHRARAAYKALFCGKQGNFAQRLENVSQRFAGTRIVMEMVDFINTPSRRSLCLHYER